MNDLATMSEDAQNVVVMHMGSERFCYGLAQGGIDGCKVERSLVGRPRATAHVIPFSHSQYIGNRAWASRHILTPSFPINKGYPGTDYEILLRHGYLESDPFNGEPLPLLLTEPYQLSRELKEKECEFAFEELKVPLFGLSPSAELVMHAQGLQSGVVVDIGLSSTRIIPVLHRSIVKEAVNELEVGGEHITRNLIKCLSMRAGWSLTGSQALFEEIDDMKKVVCYVAKNLEHEVEIAEATPKAIEAIWAAPTSQQHTVGAPRFWAPEVLFNPSCIDLDAIGIDQLITNSVHRTPKSALVASHIILSGGSSLLPGLATRIESNLQQDLNSKKVDVEIAEAKEAPAAWIGAAKLAQDFALFNSIAITKAQYEEQGPSSIHARPSSLPH